MKLRKLAIVIPAHNEQESLQKVLDGIPPLEPSLLCKVFVVDDGSSDDTFKIANKAGVEVVRHAFSLGVGGAMKTGYLLAKEWGADIVVQLDADGQHDPQEIERILQPVLNGEADIVIGSRFLNGSVLPLSWTRRAGIRFFSKILNRLTGYGLTDLTSGYRAISGKIIESVAFSSEKHFAVEMALLANKNGLTVVEVPISPLERKSGESQFHDISTLVLYPFRVLRQIVNTYF